MAQNSIATEVPRAGENTALFLRHVHFRPELGTLHDMISQELDDP